MATLTIKRILPKSYNRLMKTLGNSIAASDNDVVSFRLKVLRHGEKYGWKAALDAFNVSKATYYRWRRMRLKHPGNPLKLTPKKTRPKRVREMKTDYRLIELVRTLRERHGNLSKYKLKPFVDALCKELGIPTISVSTIGKIIKRKQLFYDELSRLLPADQTKKRNHQKRERARYSPKPSKAGYLEIDSITTYVNGIRYYFMCAIDVYSRMAFARVVPSLSSRQAKITIEEFFKLLPVKVYAVQTDNGSEFFGEFDTYLQELNIQHIFTYPRCPKVNAHNERFNRTIQEEFINRSDEIYYDFDAFCVKLKEWLVFYNFSRPHQALGYLAPYQFLTSKSLKCV